MQKNRNNNVAVTESEAILRQTEASIDTLEERLLNEKLTNRQFLQLYNERGALMIKRRTALYKLKNARQGEAKLNY